jgi:putative ABC transport system permease protein
VIAGSYFTSSGAPEAIVHEYLLYKWGMLTDGDYAKVLGQKVKLKTIQTELTPEQQAPPMLQEFMRDLSDEERKAMQVLLPKLLKQFGQSNERRAAEREFTVVGVLREQMPGDPFNVIEDGNAVQADVFLPQETARELFLASAVNVELGYPRALVTVTEAEFAPEVEQTLRDKGYTAFSVASALKQIESVLLMITVSISFLTGIALIVSTLGIVNTMITSVIERTREIGIFKAVGATNAQVMTVFLCESAMIGMIGGLLGLGLAALAMIPGDMLAVQLINEKAAIPFDQPVFVLPLWLIIAGPALGTGTAILAAILPARRAARIDPVKALRHD